jgi:hypothetical protein
MKLEFAEPQRGQLSGAAGAQTAAPARRIQ